MDFSKQININNLHHAYFFEDRSASIRASLSTRGEEGIGDSIVSWLEQNGIKCVGSPNFYRITNPNFGIEDSHNIKFFQSQSVSESQDSEKKIIIIEAESFTNEAQNALLKVFEEPSQDSHFFIITSNKDNLLVTLRSRMEYVRTKCPEYNRGAEKSLSKDKQKETVNFLKENPKRRLDIVKDMIDAFKDKSEERTKNTILEFLNSLETLLYNRYKSEGINLDKDKIFIFEEIVNCRKYMILRGASVKMLLEHLAFVLPVI